MADVQISGLTTGSAVADADVLVVEQGGGPWTTFKITAAMLWTYILSKILSGVSSGQIMFNSAGSIDGATKTEIDANGSIVQLVDTSPLTPSAGELTSHAAYLGTLERPAWVNSEAKAHLAQDLLAAKRFVLTTALVGNASRLHVGISDSTEGTAGAVAPTFADLPNSLVKTHITSAATAGSSASLRYAALYMARGNAAGAGGFTVRFLWHPNDAATVALSLIHI